MLNLHLNGDIVRCPDIANIQRRLIEQRLQQCRCKYGMEEIKCHAWINHCNNQPDIKPISQFGRCFLSCSESCPMRTERKINGLKTKNYKIDNVVYRKISSASHLLVKTSEYKTLFLTLTFPKFKTHVTLKEINRYFSKFMENLRKNYDCTGYIAVREHGSKNNRIHFHLLVSLPFIPFPILNTVWCNTIDDICEYSPNAVQTDPKTKFINNPIRAMRYVCKYFSKAKGQLSESRLVFISNNLLSEEIKTNYVNFDTGEITIDVKRVSRIKKQFPVCNIPYNDLLKKYKSVKVTQTSDYTTAFRITDKLEFERFCTDYLYILFRLPDDSKQLITG